MRWFLLLSSTEHNVNVKPKPLNGVIDPFEKILGDKNILLDNMCLIERRIT